MTFDLSDDLSDDPPPHSCLPLSEMEYWILVLNPDLLTTRSEPCCKLTYRQSCCLPFMSLLWPSSGGCLVAQLH